MSEKDIKQLLLLNGLKNAVQFNGQPNKKAIMGKLMASRPDLRAQTKIILPILDQVIDEISKLDIEEMTTLSIYMLMEEKGANVFGLWSASKSELLKSFEKQIGFKI